MNINKLYHLLTWVSPSFPIGSFSYPHGIENAVEHEYIHDRLSLEKWLSAIIQFGSARNDSKLLYMAYTAISAPNDCIWSLEDVLQYAHAFQATAELRLETTAQGKAFLDTLLKVYPNKILQNLKNTLQKMICEPTLPIVLAAVCVAEEIPLELALTAYLQSFTHQLVSAGTKLIPLGQTDSQHVIAALYSVIQELIFETMQNPSQNLGSATFMHELVSMQHETQYTRLFRS